MTMSRISCHTVGPEAEAGCDQSVNAPECLPVDAELRAALGKSSGKISAPSSMGGSSSPGTD